MKIDPAIARQIANPRQSSTAGGANFAQLIEQGSSAADVMASRALGFAENGLLGIHAAVLSDPAQDAAAPPLSVPAAVRPQRQPPQSGPLVVSVTELLRDTPALAAGPRAGSVAELPFDAGAALTMALPARLADQSAAAAAASPAPQLALASNPAEPELPTPVRAAWQRTAAIARSTGAVRFELNMLDQQVVAVVTDMQFGQLDEHDLSRIRDTAVREFGVTVGRIVIRPKPEISAGNQRGN